MSDEAFCSDATPTGAWKLVVEGGWRRPYAAPVHILEGRASLLRLRRAARSKANFGHSVLSIGDNLSEILAGDRGRRNDWAMRALLLRSLAYQAATGMRWRRRYIETDRNYSDFGSRKVDLGIMQAGDRRVGRQTRYVGTPSFSVPGPPVVISIFDSLGLAGSDPVAVPAARTQNSPELEHPCPPVVELATLVPPPGLGAWSRKSRASRRRQAYHRRQAYTRSYGDRRDAPEQDHFMHANNWGSTGSPLHFNQTPLAPPSRPLGNTARLGGPDLRTSCPPAHFLQQPSGTSTTNFVAAASGYGDKTAAWDRQLIAPLCFGDYGVVPAGSGPIFVIMVGTFDPTDFGIADDLCAWLVEDASVEGQIQDVKGKAHSAEMPMSLPLRTQAG